MDRSKIVPPKTKVHMLQRSYKPRRSEIVNAGHECWHIMEYTETRDS